MHLLVWFPGSPRDPFMQYVSVVKPPEGLKAITEPFLSAGESPGSERLPRRSGRQPEPFLHGNACACQDIHTRMHTCVHVR